MTDLTGRGPMGQKIPRFESPTLRSFARGQACTLLIPGVCSHGNDQTVLCHVRMPGTGVATKPDDWWAYHGCATCHAFEEAGKAGWDDVLVAVYRTQRRVYEAFGTLTP